MLDINNEANCLHNKVILITGASDGIGAQAAKSFAAQGATVILLGKSIPKLEAVYDQIVAAGGPEPAIYPMNLMAANPDHYSQCAEKIQESFGRLDGLLHNAAYLGTMTPIEHYDIQEWYKVIQTNLNAPFHLTKVLLPLLKQSDSSSIIFTSDAVGRKAKAYWGPYCLAKFAMEGFSQLLSEELDNTSVRVNCINPGVVATKLRAKAYPAEDASELTKPEEIMPLYIYLMSDKAKNVRQQSLNAQEVGMMHA